MLAGLPKLSLQLDQICEGQMEPPVKCKEIKNCVKCRLYCHFLNKIVCLNMVHCQGKCQIFEVHVNKIKCMVKCITVSMDYTLRADFIRTSSYLFMSAPSNTKICHF